MNVTEGQSPVILGKFLPQYANGCFMFQTWTQTLPPLFVVVVGIITLLSLFYRFTRVLLSLFVVPGKSVQSILDPIRPASKLTRITVIILRPSRLLGHHNRCQRWHRQRIRPCPRQSRLQPPPRLSHAVQTRRPFLLYYPKKLLHSR